MGAEGIHGNIDSKERDNIISKFKKDPSTRILIATPGVAKEGLTLVAANYAIFYDRNFSLENYSVNNWMFLYPLSLPIAFLLEWLLRLILCVGTKQKQFVGKISFTKVLSVKMRELRHVSMSLLCI